MIRINLLPQEERAKQRRLPTIKLPHVGAVVPFVVLGVVVGLVATIAAVQGRQLAKLNHDIELARVEQARYKPQLEKIRQITQRRQEVRSRLDIIAKLDRERYHRVQLLDDMSKSMPRNTWISGVQELSTSSYQIDGVTFSNFIVADFMQRLEKTDRFTKVDLAVAQKGTIDELNVVQFSLISDARP